MYKYIHVFVKSNYVQFILFQSYVVCCMHFPFCVVIFEEVFSIKNLKMWVDGSLNLQSVTCLVLISSTRFLKPLLINYEPLLSQAVLWNNFGDYKITAAKVSIRENPGQNTHFLVPGRLDYSLLIGKVRFTYIEMKD